MGVSSTSRAFVSPPPFPSFDIHASPEGRLTPAVGLAPVEGFASAEGLVSQERLDYLVSHDVASASVNLG